VLPLADWLVQNMPLMMLGIAIALIALKQRRIKPIWDGILNRKGILGVDHKGKESTDYEQRAMMPNNKKVIDTMKKTFNIDFIGREAGAIGIFYRINQTVEAIDEDDAINNLWKTHEYNQIVSCKEA
jgi:hypothetical protein